MVGERFSRLNTAAGRPNIYMEPFQEFLKYGGEGLSQQQPRLEAGKNTHENIIYACFGGFSNTGVTAALASIEAVKELGLKKAAIGCLAGLPTEVPPVFAKTKAARRVVSVDGCPFECSRKTLEKAGFAVTKSIVLVRDIGMKKKALHEEVEKGSKPLMDYISEDDVRRAKELIIGAVCS